jgi:hypothetical protein
MPESGRRDFPIGRRLSIETPCEFSLADLSASILASPARETSRQRSRSIALRNPRILWTDPRTSSLDKQEADATRGPISSSPQGLNETQ